MDIKVNVPAVMLPLTKQQKVITGNGSTIRDLIDNLEQGNPGIKDRLVSADELNRYVNIFVNEQDIRFSGKLDATVKAGDEITILPAVAGG